VNPQELLYSKTHEWLHLAEEGGAKVATIGLSAFAIEQLTDLVYLQLPAVGAQVAAGAPLGEVESVKAVSDLYSPVSGEVLAVNARLASDLETLSKDPYGEGWIAKVRVTDETGLGALLKHEQYERQCAEEH